MSEKLSMPDSIANNFALEEQSVGDTGRVLIVAESNANHNHIDHPHSVNAPEAQKEEHVKTRGLTYSQTEIGGKPFIVAARPNSSKRSEPRTGEPATVVSAPTFGSNDKAPVTSANKAPSDDGALNRKEILTKVRKDMIGALGMTALSRNWGAKNEKLKIGRRNKRAGGIVEPSEYKKPVDKIVFKDKPTDEQVQTLAREKEQAKQAQAREKVQAEQAEEAGKLAAERANRNEPDPSSRNEDEGSTKGKRKRVVGSRSNQSHSNPRVRIG